MKPVFLNKYLQLESDPVLSDPILPARDSISNQHQDDTQLTLRSTPHFTLSASEASSSIPATRASSVLCRTSNVASVPTLTVVQQLPSLTLSGPNPLPSPSDFQRLPMSRNQPDPHFSPAYPEPILHPSQLYPSWSPQTSSASDFQRLPISRNQPDPHFSRAYPEPVLHPSQLYPSWSPQTSSASDFQRLPMSRNRPDPYFSPAYLLPAHPSQLHPSWSPLESFPAPVHAPSSLSKKKNGKPDSAPGAVKKNIQLITSRKSVDELALPPEKKKKFRELLERCIPCSVCFVDEIEFIVQTQLQNSDFSPFLQTNKAGEQVWDDRDGDRHSNGIGTKTLKTIAQCSKDFSIFLKSPSREAFKKFHSAYLRRLGLQGGLRSSKAFLDKGTFDAILDSPNTLSRISPEKALSKLRLMKLVLLKHMQCLGIYIFSLSNHRLMVPNLYNMRRRKGSYYKSLITTHAFLSYADKAIGIISDGELLPVSFWSDIDLFSEWVISLYFLET